MERNPKKSKAFIITFIAILLLLIVGYLIFRSNGTIFGIKSSTSTNKSFTSLLGTSKDKNIDTNVINNSNTTVDNTSTNVSGTNLSGTDSNATPGSASTPAGQNGGVKPNGTTIIPPPFNPLPTPTTDCKDKNGNLIPCDNTPSTNIIQCSDGIDNDGDNLVDTADSGCHTDYNAQNGLSYDKNIDNESRAQTVISQTDVAMCPDDPLVFTEEEKAQLAVLLKQYYLLAPTLKIEDDVTLVDYDNVTNEELIKQANSLINDCKAQKADPTYTGPREVMDNPYYQNPIPNSNAKEYIPGYGLYELMFNIW